MAHPFPQPKLAQPPSHSSRPISLLFLWAQETPQPPPPCTIGASSPWFSQRRRHFANFELSPRRAVPFSFAAQHPWRCRVYAAAITSQSQAEAGAVSLFLMRAVTGAVFFSPKQPSSSSSGKPTFANRRPPPINSRPSLLFSPNQTELSLSPPMPAIGRSPLSEHCRPSPRANTFASTRRIHFLTFPFLSPSEINHHRHLPYRPELSPSHRRSGLLPHSLSRPPPSPDARRSGTCFTADVAVPRQLEHRRPSLPPLGSQEETEEKKRRKKKAKRRKR